MHEFNKYAYVCICVGLLYMLIVDCDRFVKLRR